MLVKKSIMKATFSVMVVLGVGLLAGCGKKEADPQKGATNSAASGNPITAPVDYLGAVGNAKKHAEKVIDTTSVSKAIDLFNAQEDRFPTNLNELVTSHYLPAVPVLPQGMKYQYNPQTGQIRAVRTP
jgi:hypothetical protein